MSTVKRASNTTWVAASHGGVCYGSPRNDGSWCNDDAHWQLLPVPPVDRSARCTVGEAVAPGVANTEDRGDGQQKGYVILCDQERRRGFVRPVRRTYLHTKCGTTTTMGDKLAETYARDPKFYSGTFCCTCRDHFPVGPDGEFVWDGTSEKVGT